MHVAIAMHAWYLALLNIDMISKNHACMPGSKPDPLLYKRMAIICIASFWLIEPMHSYTALKRIFSIVAISTKILPMQ